jgi:hypothetical protein
VSIEVVRWHGESCGCTKRVAKSIRYALENDRICSSVGSVEEAVVGGLEDNRVVEGGHSKDERYWIES